MQPIAPKASALRDLLEFCNGCVSRIAIIKHCPSSDVPDIAQEVSVNIWQYTRRHDGRLPSKALVIAMIKRRVVDFFRKQSRSPLWRAGQLEESLMQTSRCVNTQHRSSRSKVAGMLDQLRPKAKQIMVRHFLHGESVEQIAAATGMTCEGIRSSIWRSRKRIKRGQRSRNAARLNQ